MSRDRSLLHTAAISGRNRHWIIRAAGDEFQVGFRSRQTQEFNPVCSCDNYDQARQICDTLKGLLHTTDFLAKGAE